jgi:hypothetical protein
MLQGRGARAAWGIAVPLAVVWACETARNPAGIQRDLTPPAISLTAGADTQGITAGLSFGVSATDNLGLKNIRLTYSGGYIALTDTLFTSTVTGLSFPVQVTFPANSGAGGLIRIVGRATDGAGNFAEDTVFIFLSNVQALRVTLVAPSTGAVAGQNKYVPIRVIAVQESGIRRIGWLVSPPTGQTARAGDSLVNVSPFPDSVERVDSVLVTGTTGFFTIVGFAVDFENRVATTPPVTVNILSVANDVTPPQVEHTVGLRAEVGDTVRVHATDPSGISRVGFTVRDLGGTQLHADSVTLSGTSTDVVALLAMNVPGITTFPSQVVVQGFAVDGATAQNRGVSGATFATVSPTGPARADTVTLVAGITRSLPLGGRIEDAIFNANRGELYLTNPPLSRVEVFQVANTSFVAGGIRTAGPQPWGIALWPRDTLGAYGDSIVVANSGGTQLSIVDVVTRRLKWRQDLPNFLIERYKVMNQVGVWVAQIEIFDVSDRPQYVGTVCRPAGGTACAPDSIFAIYSTTPTVSSSSPFSGHATLRMEKLVNTTDTSQLFGHLFWEIGARSGTDTLRIELMRGLPYNQRQVVLSACAGVTINFGSFGLGDRTYVRNSGNFTHAFIGEGGSTTADFARVMAYSTKAGLLQGALTPPPTTCFTSPDTSASGPTDAGRNDVDFGMSPGVDVRDFISNTGTTVQAIATNFNGGTNLVRADSVYYLDEGLRLKGSSCTLGADQIICATGAPGMDMNYNHDFAAGSPGSTGFGGTRDSTDRVAFAARPDASIDVFDTFFYGKIGSIPVRDAIIGPLRVARDVSGAQLLFGITARGLVMVRLPVIPNPNPAPPVR